MIATIKQMNLLLNFLEYGFPVQNSSGPFLKFKKEKKPTPRKHWPKKAPSHPTTALQNAPTQNLISLGDKYEIPYFG